MEQSIALAHFDETQLAPDERAFLDYQDFRMQSVGQQFKLESGRILKETREWFRIRHKWGFEDFAKKTWGFDRDQVHYLIRTFDDLMDVENFPHLGLSLSAQLELKEAPNQQAAIDEVKIRQELEEKITAKKAKEIADLQRAEQIARDEMRSAQDRVSALDRQLAYAKQQLEQAKTAQKPQTIEVEKKVEVVPQHVLDRQKKLEERVRELQTQKTQLQAESDKAKKERDRYKRDLDKERQDGNALFLKNLEPEGTSRLRANFAEVMHEIVAWCRTSGMKLPSVVDTQVFEAEDWHRLEEAIQANALLGRELRKIKDMVSSPQVHQPFIIDTTVEEWVS